jgi:putative transposase
MSCGSSSPGASSRGFRFPAEIINQAAGYTTASASACASRVNHGGAGYRGQLRDHPRVAPALRASLTPKTLKQRRPQPGGKWYLDDVFVRIRGKLHSH